MAGGGAPAIRTLQSLQLPQPPRIAVPNIPCQALPSGYDDYGLQDVLSSECALAAESVPCGRSLVALGRSAWDALSGVPIKVNPLFWVAVAATGLSGFFSLCGFALRSFRRAALEDAFSGANRQRRLEALARNLKALRLTVALCRALMNLIIVAALIYLFDSEMRFWPALAAIAAAAAIIATFGVAIPHAWAAYAGEKVLARTLGVLMFFRYALYPVTAVMLAFDSPIRRLSGAPGDNEQNGVSAKQEILQAASQAQAEGAVDAEEVQMIDSVIEFGQTQAGEIMTPRTDIFALPVDTPWAEAIERIVAAGHTRVPVCEGDLDHIVGLLYAKDMLKLAGGPKPAEVRDILRKCYFVPETKPLDDLLREFKARKVHMAILLDEYGGTAGLITIEDVVEEIVGEISDEYDATAAAAIKQIDQRTAEVDGRFYIDELNDALNLELPEDEDYDTVAGFVFSELGFIPAAGETLESHGVRLTVLAADERKITRLRVEVLETDKQEDEE